MIKRLKKNLVSWPKKALSAFSELNWAMMTFSSSAFEQFFNRPSLAGAVIQKFRIRETPTLSTDADSRTDTNLKGKQDLSFKKKWGGGRSAIYPLTRGL